MDYEICARKVHEANRAYCKAHGDVVDPAWEDLDDDRKLSILEAVEREIKTPAASPRESHDRWCQQRLDEGWVLGEVKDVEAKTHPCLVDYDALPEVQKQKDVIFAATVRQFRERFMGR